MKEEVKSILRKHIDNHESPVNLENLWAGVQKEIKPNNRKRRFLFIPLFLGITVCSFLFLNSNNNAIPNGELNSSLSLNQEKTEILTNASTENKISVHLDENINLNNQTAVTKESISTQKTAKAKILKTKKTQQTQQTLLSQKEPSSSLINNTNASSSVSKKLNPQIITPSQIIQTEKNTKAKNVTNQIETNAIDLANQIQSSLINQESLNTQEGFTYDIAVLDNVSALIPTKRELKLATKKFIIDENDLILIKPKRKHFILAASFSYGTFSSERTQISEDNDAYLNDLSAAQSSLEMMTGDIDIVIPLNNKFSLGTGISYQRAQESFSWKGSYYVDNDGQNLGLKPENIDPTNVLGFSSAYSKELERDMNIYNLYHYVDIPINLYFHQQIGTLSINYFAGVAYNIYNHSEGFTLDEKRIPIEFKNTDQPNQGLRYNIGANINFAITRKIDIFTKVHFSQRSYEMKEILFKQKGYSLGFGLMHEF